MASPKSENQAVEIATMKNQMTVMGNDVSELKGDVKKVVEQMQQLLISWEGAKATYVSAEQHNAALQAVRTEMAQQLDKHTKEHTEQVALLQTEVAKLNGVYLKLAGAGAVIAIILSQLKNIIEWVN